MRNAVDVCEIGWMGRRRESKQKIGLKQIVTAALARRSKGRVSGGMMRASKVSYGPRRRHNCLAFGGMQTG